MLRRRFSFGKISLLLLALLLLVAPAWAQDRGAQQLKDAPIGPYLISVRTTPDPLLVGRVHVIATLISPTGEPLTKPQITIVAHALHRDSFQAVMTPEEESYAADFDIPYSGPWRFELNVMGDKGAGSVSFTVAIQPQPINKNLIRLGAFATLMVLIIGWWFWGRHPRKKRARKRIFMPRPDEKK